MPDGVILVENRKLRETARGSAVELQRIRSELREIQGRLDETLAGSRRIVRALR